MNSTAHDEPRMTHKTINSRLLLSILTLPSLASPALAQPDLFSRAEDNPDRWRLNQPACAIFNPTDDPAQPLDEPPPEDDSSSGNASNDANNPLTPKITFNLHDYYIPSFYGLDDRDANQFLLRGVIPHKLAGLPQLFRFTLPIAEAPTFPDGTDTGLGDLTLIDWFVIPTGNKNFQLGVGPVLVLPTASTDALGAGKWQAGASAVAIAPQKWGLLGGLVTFQQSFAGDDGRDDVTLLTLQPFFIYNIPKGFYLRSTAIWNFDLNNDTYYIPAGFGLGKVWVVGSKTTLNAFVEPQYTVFHDGVAPQWQIFAGLNFQFAF